MGVFDFVKKMATGASDEDNRKNKARMREIFNSLVPNGDDYKLIYCHMEDYHNAVVVEVNVHSNYIVGYKPGEVVVIAVEADLTKYEKPEFFNRENGSQTEASWTGYCVVKNSQASYQFVPVTYEPGINRGAKYSVAVTQSSEEVSAFRKFFKAGL